MPRITRSTRALRVSDRTTAAPGDMKPELTSATSRRALSTSPATAVLGYSDRRGPGHQHSDAGKTDPAPEASEYAEVRELGEEIAEACAEPPACVWDARRPPSRSRRLWRATPNPTSTPPQSRKDLEHWARAESAERRCAVRSGRPAAARRYARRYRRRRCFTRSPIARSASYTKWPRLERRAAQ